MRQELRVGVLLELGEGLQGFVLELNCFIEILLATVYCCDFNVTVPNLLRLGAKRHLVELPGLAEDVQGRLVVLLTEVDLANDLEDLAVRWVCVSQDLLVHLEGFLEQAQRILEVTRLHVAVAE